MLINSAIDLSTSLQPSLPNTQAVDATIKDLQTANVDISTVRVLHGEKGADILDPRCSEHE